MWASYSSTEIPKTVHYRKRSGLSQPTRRRQHHGAGQLLQSLQVLPHSPSISNPGQRFHHRLRSLAARGALAAGFLGKELHRPAHDIHHVPAPVKDNDRPWSQHSLVGERHIHLVSGHNSSRGASDLDHLDVSGEGKLLDQLSQRAAHLQLVHPGALHVAADGEHLRPLALRSAHLAESIRSVGHDPRYVHQGLHVVDQRREAQQPLRRRKRWPGPRLAPSAPPGIPSWPSLRRRHSRRCPAAIRFRKDVRAMPSNPFCLT